MKLIFFTFNRTTFSNLAVYLCLILLISSCNIFSSNMGSTIDIQGHRGCRGLMPENTIPAFIHAINLGVNTLELDVVATKEGVIFVSHEPFFSHEISTAPSGEEITKENERAYNIYTMTANEVKSIDVGTKINSRFLLQKKMSVVKPTLREMVTSVESYVKSNNLADILYNIEIKREPQNDEIFHPKMEIFADLVCNELAQLGILDRTTVQCFDIETLKYLHGKYPKIDLVYLVMDTNPFEENLDRLGFLPAVYSPYFKLVTEELVKYGNKKSIKIIPWTVNEEEDINLMLDLNVDGIISDYPDKLIEIEASRKASL
ncbi:MAG: glycerophosphoryl diester phosphodiesterase [Saprospiraceae bacterium]|jgi:glycerophosphoryl diester phosphodiesterase